MRARTHYRPRSHGLPHNPLKAVVAPRPIAWVSTYSATGIANLAPYSFFNLVSDDPPIVMFSSTGYKDTVRNIETKRAFAINLATLDLADEVSASSAALPPDASEFRHIGRDPVRCTDVDAPMLEEAGAVLECRLTEIREPQGLDGTSCGSFVVFGEVVGYDLADDLMLNGMFDTARAQSLARLGYREYAAVERTFEIARPKD